VTTCPFNDAAHLHADPDGCPSCIAHELRQWKHLHDDNECIRRTGNPQDCPHCNEPEPE